MCHLLEVVDTFSHVFVLVVAGVCLQTPVCTNSSVVLTPLEPPI